MSQKSAIFNKKMNTPSLKLPKGGMEAACYQFSSFCKVKTASLKTAWMRFLSSDPGNRQLYSSYKYSSQLTNSEVNSLYSHFSAPWMALFPCFRWSFANGKTPIPKIGMEADFREKRWVCQYGYIPAFFATLKPILR